MSGVALKDHRLRMQYVSGKADRESKPIVFVINDSRYRKPVKWHE